MNYRSRSFSFTYNLQSIYSLCLLSANYFFLPLDTFNPLFSAKSVRLTTSSQVGGKVLWLCCAGLHVAAGTGSAPCQSSASNTFQVFPCSYWIDNLGFITKGKLVVVLIIPSSWGSPMSSIYFGPSTARTTSFTYMFMAKYSPSRHNNSEVRPRDERV